MFFTFNELSAKHISLSKGTTPRDTIDELIVFLNKLSKNNLIDEIILPSDIFSIHICDNYGLAEWFADKNVDEKHKQFFKRFLDKKCKYYSPSDVNGDFEIHISDNKYKAIGCSFAFEHEHLLVSLSTNRIWERSPISGDYIFIDCDGMLHTDKVDIDNFWTKADEKNIIALKKEEIYDKISSGQDLWEKYKSLFPNLVLCDNVKHQLYNDSEKFHIVSIMKKLSRLQEYFSTYNGIYNPKELGMDARTESDTVKNELDLKNLRLFKKPNGEEDYFFDHISFCGKYSDGRIHFLPDNDNKMCYIGYIGRHLKTKKF